MNTQQRIRVLVATLHTLAGATSGLKWTDLSADQTLQSDLAILSQQVTALAIALRQITKVSRPTSSDISSGTTKVLDVCSLVLTAAGDDSEKTLKPADVKALIAQAVASGVG